MTLQPLSAGFLPLVDAAPLVIARELGFAEEEGLDLVLHREPSWSALRDNLALGGLAAAHMLSPVPLAMSMGLGGMPMCIDLLSVLSINGAVVGASPALADRMRARGAPGGFASAAAIGRALANAADRRLRVGVPFPFSMHAELLDYWLGALGPAGPEHLSVHTVPPPMMAEAVAAGEIDAFCVGEPWGSVAVESGAAELILPSCAIWGAAPEKVLAVRHACAEEQPETAAALMRSVWRAARWLSAAENKMTTAEILSREAYLDVSSEIVERALTGLLVTGPAGEQHRVPRFLEFFDTAATFPWRS